MKYWRNWWHTYTYLECVANKRWFKYTTLIVFGKIQNKNVPLLKYAFSMFLCKKSENGRKRKKAEKTRKSIKKLMQNFSKNEFLSLHQNTGQGVFTSENMIFLGIKQLTSFLVQTSQNPFFAKLCIKFLAFPSYFSFLRKERWKSMFGPAFGVCSTQTLV